MSGVPPDLDPRYVEARRVLLDALIALAPHGRAVIVAGAQAVYLRTGSGDISVAPFTTDSDLALDPAFLGDEPALEAAMSGAGFHLYEQASGDAEPGIWVVTAHVAGERFVIPVDLIVPRGAATGGGRRGARLGIHGKRAARQILGLEAALVDHDTMTIAALDHGDARSIQAEVAGVAALLVAKAHKIHDRLTTARPGRLDDKDAADVYRLMQETSPATVGATLSQLRGHTIAGAPSATALDYLGELFGAKRSDGVLMASRALRLGVPEERVAALCVSYVERLLVAARSESR